MTAPAGVSHDDKLDDLQSRYFKANHGLNWFMPFFNGALWEFQRACLERAADKYSRPEVGESLFGRTGVCAFNPQTRMVFSPSDITPEQESLLSDMGIKTILLVCVRAGFLDTVLFDSPPGHRKPEQVSALFDHMRSVHNARVFVVGYDDDRFLTPKNSDLWRFIKHNELGVAYTDPGRGLSTAIKNAKHFCDGEIFSRTLYFDNNSKANESGTCESGYDIAKTAHAAALISSSIYRCPKCNEPWTLGVYNPDNSY